MKDNFYKTLEKKFQETKETIKEKEKVYLSFVTPLYDYYSEGEILNIGSASSEWLKCMKNNGILVKNVDIDAEEPDRDTVRDDGIALLSTVEDESAIVITAFHVAEYISFDQLRKLVSEAHRVLKPGGLLIIETLNPENIRIASETFYLDPTRTKPIPHNLLSFMTEYYGFEQNKIIRLQEADMFSTQKYANISQLLEGVSPDYAVIAKKKSGKEIDKLLDIPFEKNYGLSLPDLIEKFERRMLRFEELSNKIMKKVGKAEEFAWKAEIQVSKAFGSVQQTEESAKIAAESAENAWKHYQIVVNSPSWKVSKPLRIFGHMTRSARTSVKQTVKSILRSAGRTIHKYPKLKTRFVVILNRFPRLKQKLMHIFTGVDTLYHNEGRSQINAPEPFMPNKDTVVADLKKAIDEEKVQK